MPTPGEIVAQAGLSGYDQAHAHKVQRKDMLIDEDRQLKASDLINTRNSILSKLPTLLGPNGEKTPEYDQAYQSLTQAQQGLGQLYHPDKAPGALQKDWHFLLEKMHGITGAKDKTPSSTTSQAPAMTLNSPAAPGASSSTATYRPTMGAGPSTPAALLPVTPENGGMQIPNTPGFGPTTAPSSQEAPTQLTITQSFEGKPAPGMVSQGNLDLSKRPNINNGDGTHSSTFSMSFGTDKGTVLVPGVGDGKTYPERQLRVLYTLPDGTQKWAVPGNQPHNWIAPERPTPQNNEALNQYQKTGKHFGIFEDEKAADSYGKALHEDQEKYGNNGVTAHPVSPSGNVAAKIPHQSWGQVQVLKQKAASMQKAQQDANLLVAGAPLSPMQQAMSQFRAEDAVHQAQVDASLKLAEKLGITGPALEEFKQQLVGIKNVTPKPLTGAAGAPYKGPDGIYRQAISNPDGTVGFRQMPPDWKPNTKAVRGTLRNIKGIGFIQTWVDPYNPSKVVGYQRVTPGRQYTGTTSSSSSTDSAGVTTSSSRSTMPVGSPPEDMDLSGLRELPEKYNGEDLPETPAGQTFSGSSSNGVIPSPDSAPTGSSNKQPTASSSPPPSVARPVVGVAPHTAHHPAETPAQLRNKVPAPPPSTPPAANGGVRDTDPSGHIPADALGMDGKPVNSQIREAANQLLDGVDMKDLTMASKDKPTAEAVARLYGWGRGPFLPRELKQMQNANQFLDQALNSESFMRAIDQGVWRRTATALAQKDSSKEGLLGTVGHVLAQGTLNADQKEYLNIRQALMGTVSGLSSVVRTGRATEATINRLAQEIPDVMSSADSTQAKQKIAQIKKELEVALAQGVPAPTPKNAGKPSSGSAQQLKVGDPVMLKGKMVKIKNINSDGTFDYD